MWMLGQQAVRRSITKHAWVHKKHATHIDFDTTRIPRRVSQPFHLSERATRDDAGLEKEDGKDAFQSLSHRLVELQENLYAEQNRVLLVVMQAMDAGGKDSTLKAVFGPVDPRAAG